VLSSVHGEGRAPGLAGGGFGGVGKRLGRGKTESTDLTGQLSEGIPMAANTDHRPLTDWTGSMASDKNDVRQLRRCTRVWKRRSGPNRFQR